MAFRNQCLGNGVLCASEEDASVKFLTTGCILQTMVCTDPLVWHLTLFPSGYFSIQPEAELSSESSARTPFPPFLPFYLPSSHTLLFCLPCPLNHSQGAHLLPTLPGDFTPRKLAAGQGGFLLDFTIF